ncbi:MAG: hypothetical protein M1839_008356 [Geoglossum umbratile]|nr:MAG: hypothetical protein M1839_008356 [Geoglossum umbratile]
MAPLRSKQRKASDSSAGSVARNRSPRTRKVATKTGSPARTPKKNTSPIQKRRGVTQAQKQALIDNLQLEISERARKLRAQYSLQAQGLKTRIEIRINRIPVALRKANIGELLAKYSEEQQPSGAVARQVATTEAFPALKGATKSAEPKNTSSPARGTKRLSDEMSCDANKENADLALPKKRTKATAAPAASTRNASRSKPTASQVLSPKSYNTNSRSLIHSPIRPTASPPKSNIARPVSPLKPLPPAFASSTYNAPTSIPTGVVAGMVEKIKSARTAAARKITPTTTAPSAPAGRVKRTVAQAATANAIANATGRGRAASNSSHASVSTTGTVVTRLKGRAPAPAQKTEAGGKVKAAVGRAGGLTAAAKKAAATAAVEVPAAGKRILRKRK